jgi:tetratricopeptide (TPR) repeat protein
MLTPATWRVWTYNLWHLSVGQAVELAEFRLSVPWEQPVFCALLAAAAALLALDWRRTEPWEWLVALAFGAFAVYAVRGIPDFVMVATGPVALHATDLAKRLQARGMCGRLCRLSGRAHPLPLGAALLALPLLAHVISGEGGRWRLGVGLARGFFPEGAATFVRERVPPTVNVFHDMNSGGYLAWRWHPGRGVFIDNRTNAYPPDFFRTLYHERIDADALRAVTRFHGCDAALVYFYRGRTNVFWRAFDLDEWAVVHAERPALVLVRKVAANLDVRRGFERRLTPDGRDFLVRVLLDRGLAALRSMRPDEAVGPYREALSLAPALVEARVNLGYALLDSGRPAEGLDEFDRALRARPAMPEAALGAAMCLEALGRRTEAVARYREVAADPAANLADRARARSRLEALTAPGP